MGWQWGTKSELGPTGGDFFLWKLPEITPLYYPLLVSQAQSSVKPEAKLVRPNLLQDSQEHQWRIQPLTKLSILGGKSYHFIMIGKRNIEK